MCIIEIYKNSSEIILKILLKTTNSWEAIALHDSQS